MQLHLPETLDALAALDARLVVVSFAPLDRLTAWVPFFRDSFLVREYTQLGLALPEQPFARTRFAADPALAAYSAYGLGRNSYLRIYGPRILAHYALALLAGRRLPKLNQDTRQRGGDFVVGPDGLLTFAHTGRDQADRPAVQALLAALRSST